MRAILLLSAAVLVAIPVQADPARDALAEVAKCADIAAATERLACYDKAAGTAKTAMAAAPVQQAAVEPESEGGVLEWFGLSERKPVVKAEDFGKPPAPVEAKQDGPKEITEISSTVIEFAKNAYGKSLFVLENGQIWKQVEGDTVDVRPPRPDEPMKVKIEKAFMGSFSLSVDGRNGIVKVRRVK
jgi:hypothetical protein